ncbi:unnamed protein product [Penicillium nalgiovense]|uniref:Uncharacterized protein n=1 Tax=Penicillium nalgiovense TaxID=60175 RepID=A0A1V6X7V5_PENNA|nr:hypothetical protein PENNAL_c0111G08320 [Penicillium nalgiovense]CAG8211197.1 unnamed protein product [Penicillium nalgiovense]
MSLENKHPKIPHSSTDTTPPIREQWARPTEMFEPDATQSQPTDELDTEIREAQCQLAKLRQQRWLIELQQQLADEQSALEKAWNRLAATTNKDRSPTIGPVVKDSVKTQYRKTAAARMQNGDSRYGIIQASNNNLTAPSEQNVSPSFRPPQPNSSHFKPENTVSNGPANPMTKSLRELATANRSTALPPPCSANLNTQAPPAPKVPVYHGRALGEFKNYARVLERHFKIYPEWYKTDERKINCARTHVAFDLENEWNRRIHDIPSKQITFGGFCTFLIHQLRNGVYPEVAKARYMESHQRPFQSVTDFSNWIQQWEPHFCNNFSDRDRMRHLFEHLTNTVRNKADKTHLDFTHYNDFVVYLQRVEDSIDKRAGPLGKKLNNPRKRLRTHS